MQRQQIPSQATAPRRGYGILDFCAAYNVSRSKTYEEIKEGRLKIRKVGRRTIIAVEDAESWFEACASTSA